MRPWELLLRNVNVLHSVFEKAEPELSLLKLDSKRLFILCMVDANPFPADLASVLSMPKPSMTFLIKKLEENGYLRRQREKGDLRRYRLTITPAGIKARDKGAEAVNRIFGACLHTLSAADQATLSRIVTEDVRYLLGQRIRIFNDTQPCRIVSPEQQITARGR